MLIWITFHPCDVPGGGTRGPSVAPTKPASPAAAAAAAARRPQPRHHHHHHYRLRSAACRGTTQSRQDWTRRRGGCCCCESPPAVGAHELSAVAAAQSQPDRSTPAPGGCGCVCWPRQRCGLLSPEGIDCCCRASFLDWRRPGAVPSECGLVSRLAWASLCACVGESLRNPESIELKR